MGGMFFYRQPETENLYHKQNPWVSLLRIIMCFAVIQIHYVPEGNTVAQRIVGELGQIAVPCFMFISFYFMGDDIKQLKHDRIRKRILRLYIPIFVWNIIYFGCKNIIFIIFKKTEEIISIKDLIKGILFTHYQGLPAQLWFLFVQIIILIIVCIILSYAENIKYKNAVLIVMAITAIIMEYAGINYDLFESSAYPVKYTLGRVIECIPYAAFGIFYNWNMRDKKNSIKVCVLLTCLFLTVMSRLCTSQPAGFGYGGLYIFFASASVCVLTLIIPDVIAGRLRAVINYIGSCTMGVYCVHMLIGWMVLIAGSKYSVIERIMCINTLFFDAYIFIISLGITIFIRCINQKLNWKWVNYIV